MAPWSVGFARRWRKWASPFRGPQSRPRPRREIGLPHLMPCGGVGRRPHGAPPGLWLWGRYPWVARHTHARGARSAWPDRPSCKLTVAARDPSPRDTLARVDRNAASSCSALVGTQVGLVRRQRWNALGGGCVDARFGQVCCVSVRQLVARRHPGTGRNRRRRSNRPSLSSSASSPARTSPWCTPRTCTGGGLWSVPAAQQRAGALDRACRVRHLFSPLVSTLQLPARDPAPIRYKSERARADAQVAPRAAC